MTRRLRICAILGICIPIASTAAAADAQSGWIHPIVVATGDPGVAAAARVAMDEKGDTLLVWVQYAGTSDAIEAAWRPAGGSFGTPVTLSSRITSVSSPAVAMDSRGDATVVWLATVPDSGSQLVVDAALRSFNGVFTKLAEPLSHAAFAQSPVVAMDQQGGATVAWSEDDGGANIVYAASRPAGGTFTAPVELSEFLGDAQMPAVAMDGAGAAAVAWTLNGSLRPIEHPLPLQLATRSAESSFSPFTGLSSLHAYHPTVSMNAHGEIAIAWVSVEGEEAHIDTARRNIAGEDLGEEQIAGNLFSGAAPEIQPEIGLDEAGDALLAWQYSGAFVAMQTHYYGKFNQPTFGRPIELTAPSLGDGRIGLAVDGQGNTLVTWTGTAEAGLFALGAAMPIGATGAAGTILSEFSNLHRTEAEVPPVDVAIDAYGDGAATWVSSDGSHDSIEVAGYQAVGPQLEGLQVPVGGQAGEPLLFSASPVSVWSPTTSISWSWGDGTHDSSGTEATHVYAAPGIYTVTVSASNAVGGLTLLNHDITIHATPTRPKLLEPPREYPGVVDPPPPPPEKPQANAQPQASPAFSAAFATHESTKHNLLGTLVGITAISGTIAGERLSVRCVAGCVHAFRKSIQIGRHRHARGELSIAPPLRLKRSTRIELDLQAPNQLLRFTQYEFLRAPLGVTDRIVRQGCRSVTGKEQACP